MNNYHYEYHFDLREEGESKIKFYSKTNLNLTLF